MNLQTAHRFQAALDALVEKLKEDRNILAAILFGSFSYDVVWEKSDMDLMLISTEVNPSGAEKGAERFFALTELDVNIHAFMQTRSAFKKMMTGALRSSFMHASFAKSQLLFTRDETIRELYSDIDSLGSRDRQVQLFNAGAAVLGALTKAEKFCRIKKDPHYSFIWLIYIYPWLGRIEVYLHDRIATREAILQALELNPTFFEPIYTHLIDSPKTIEIMEKALTQVDAYLTERIPLLFQLVLDYLSASGAIKSVTEIDTWFQQQYNIHDVTGVCEWLADKEIIHKVSSPIRLTVKSQVEMDELAFYYEG